MPLSPGEVNHEFMRRLHAHVESGLPPGRSPDLANFPDRALAESGWTLGHYPRRDPVTGEELTAGELSTVELQRGYVKMITQNSRPRWTHHHRARKLRGRAFKNGVRTSYWPRYNHYVQLSLRFPGA